MQIDTLEILRRIYDSEINVRFQSFWDAGWQGLLGDSSNGFKEDTLGCYYDTFMEAVFEVAKLMLKYYPDSEFSVWFRGKER